MPGIEPSSYRHQWLIPVAFGWLTATDARLRVPDAGKPWLRLNASIASRALLRSLRSSTLACRIVGPATLISGWRFSVGVKTARLGATGNTSRAGRGGAGANLSIGGAAAPTIGGPTRTEPSKAQESNSKSAER